MKNMKARSVIPAKDFWYNCFNANQERYHADRLRHRRANAANVISNCTIVANWQLKRMRDVMKIRPPNLRARIAEHAAAFAWARAIRAGELAALWDEHESAFGGGKLLKGMLRRYKAVVNLVSRVTKQTSSFFDKYVANSTVYIKWEPGKERAKKI